MTTSLTVAPFLWREASGLTNHTAKVVGAPESGTVGNFLDRQQCRPQQFECPLQPALLKIYNRGVAGRPQNRPADRRAMDPHF